MHRLFTLSFRRIANRLAQQDLNALNVAQALQNNKIPNCGQAFLYRLPRDELKEIISIPCPINTLEEASSMAVIASSKALRHHGKINEQKICNKCPFKQKCPSSKLSFTGTIENAPKDLLIFWSALNAHLKPQSIYFRHWVSAYKLGDSIIAALNDLSEGGKQIQQYERLRVFMLQKHQQIMQKKAQEVQKNEGKILTNSQLDEKFKLIQKLTQDQSLKSKKEDKQALAKIAPTSNDFSSDQVEHIQPKIIKSRETKTKQRKQIKPAQQRLQNHVGYQTIQKRQDSNTQKAYQKPQPKKIQKKHQYEQLAKDVQFQPKNPKIRVKKQPQSNPQNKKWNAKAEKGQNKYRQKQQTYQQNRNNSYNQKKGYTNKYQQNKYEDRNSKFRSTQEYEYRQPNNQQKGNKYEKQGYRNYQEPRKQKNNQSFQNYSKESNRTKSNKQEKYGFQQVKQKPSVRTSPIIQNDNSNAKPESQENQTTAGRTVRRRPRSATLTSQNQ